MEQESDTVSLGKQLHESTYKRDKDFLIDNLINIDFIRKKENIEVHEVKKTQKMELSHEYQLLYYLYYLKKEKGIENIIGYLDYPKIKKNRKITLNKENEGELEEIFKKINEIINSQMPKPKKSRICRQCAYFEFCFS